MQYIRTQCRSVPGGPTHCTCGTRLQLIMACGTADAAGAAGHNRLSRGSLPVVRIPVALILSNAHLQQAAQAAMTWVEKCGVVQAQKARQPQRRQQQQQLAAACSDGCAGRQAAGNSDSSGSGACRGRQSGHKGIPRASRVQRGSGIRPSAGGQAGGACPSCRYVPARSQRSKGLMSQIEPVRAKDDAGKQWEGRTHRG